MEDLRDLLLACRSAHEQLVRAAAQSADDGGRELARSAAQRLPASALRPLARLVGDEPDEARPPRDPLALGELAVRATTLRAHAGAPPELLEATAALQAIALHAAEREDPDAHEACRLTPPRSWSSSARPFQSPRPPPATSGCHTATESQTPAGSAIE